MHPQTRKQRTLTEAVVIAFLSGIFFVGIAYVVYLFVTVVYLGAGGPPR